MTTGQTIRDEKIKEVAAGVLAGDARAWGDVADAVRNAGGTYWDALAAVQKIFADAGRREPDVETFEDKMREADDVS
mgnify:CR=1 FL=1